MRESDEERTAGAVAAPPKSKKAKKNTNPKFLSRELVEELRDAGAYVEKVKGEPLVHIRMDFGDAAFKIYASWYMSLSEDVDLKVVAVVAPPPNIVGTIVAPDPAIGFALQTECNALINHFAPLRLGDFAGGALPVIPPAAAVAIPIQVHHASFSLSKIFQAICAPPAVGYPTITSLADGSYICHVLQQWSNAAVTVILSKL